MGSRGPAPKDKQTVSFRVGVRCNGLERAGRPTAHLFADFNRQPQF